MTSEGPERPDSFDASPKRSTVVIWLGLTAILLIGVLWLLIYRSFAFVEPQRVITVQGNPSWIGSEITLVSSGHLKRFSTSIDASGKQLISFFVPPGQYTLRVRYDGRQIYEQPVDATTLGEKLVQLSANGPATRPSTQPATQQ